METSDPFDLVGTRLGGTYDVEALVAEGGFGVVYRATHRALRRPVAVKVLKVPPGMEGAERRAFLDAFATEARLVAALEHPAVVRVLDFGASLMPRGEAAPWMILEWVEGETLADDLDARRGRGGRSPVECLALLGAVFDALALAHDGGIAHRDMKPGNIMLALDRRGGHSARVLDFGIAKVIAPEEAAPGDTVTRTLHRAFSPDYAAPEQLAGTRTGPWTDVHALGLLVTELLTDAAPYDGDDLHELFADAVSAQRPTPAKRGYDVGAWEPILARAVALRPADRYPNARALWEALAASVPDVVRAPAAAVSSPASPRADTFNLANSARDTSPRRTPGSRAVVAAVFLGCLAILTGLAAGHGERDSRVTAARVPAAPLLPPRTPLPAPIIAPPTVPDASVAPSEPTPRPALRVRVPRARRARTTTSERVPVE